VNEKNETYLEAKVVDPVAVIKVKAGVYKGFSVQGKALQDSTNPKILSMQKITEWSLVDRPCNGRSMIHTSKIEGGKDADNADKQQTTEAVRAMENQLKKALAALDQNVILAQTIHGVSVLKSLVADEKEWVGEAALKDRRDIIDAADHILRVAKSLAPASLQQDIQKAIGSASPSASQDVVKALTDSQTVLKGEVSKIVEAAKAYGMPDTTTTEQFIQHVFKRIADLSALPGAANIATRSVSKGEDSGGKGGEITIKPVMMPGTNQEDKAATEIKKIHAAGGTPYDPIQIVG